MDSHSLSACRRVRQRSLADEELRSLGRYMEARSRSRFASCDKRLRSDVPRNRFRRRMDFGVTSINSSSSIYSRAASNVNSRGGSSCRHAASTRRRRRSYASSSSTRPIARPTPCWVPHFYSSGTTTAPFSTSNANRGVWRHPRNDRSARDSTCRALGIMNAWPSSPTCPQRSSTTRSP